MFFKKNNLDKELGKIKSDLENMMLEHQRKVDEELNTLYDEMRENLTVIVKDDEQILKEVKERVVRGKGSFVEIVLNDKKIIRLF